MNKKIDIIIPFYNVERNIFIRCLSSIICQNNLEELQLILVDDNSNMDYSDIIEIFKKFIDIKFLRLNKNSGPGVARQYGIDNSSNEFIVFVDADDTLKGSFALTILKNNIGNKYDLCVADFEEVHDENKNNLVFKSYKNNMTWVFSKIYRRSFLEKNNIRFHPTSRANEDSGFNTMIDLLTNNIKFIPDKLYYWHNNPNSITRKNDAYYAESPEPDNSFYGFVENKIYSINFAKNKKYIAEKYIEEIVKSMTYLYEQYLKDYNKKTLYLREKYKLCLKFYKEIYYEYKDNISIKIKVQDYEKVTGFYRKHKHLPSPTFSFTDFLEDLNDSI